MCGLLHSREIFRVLDLMKADMVNFSIHNLRPVLQRQSVEYERATFQSIVDKTPSEYKSSQCTAVIEVAWEAVRGRNNKHH